MSLEVKFTASRSTLPALSQMADKRQKPCASSFKVDFAESCPDACSDPWLRENLEG